jgi:hypothetical protein
MKNTMIKIEPGSITSVLGLMLTRLGHTLKALLITAGATAGLFSALAHADIPGRHPHYLDALSDLRNARWFLERQPGDVKVYQGEDVAIDEVNAALREIKKAGIDDGKNINDHVKIDVREYGSRLLRAIEAIKKAQHDVSLEEDNPEARGLKHRSQEHLDKAFRAALRAHTAWLKEHGK